MQNLTEHGVKALEKTVVSKITKLEGLDSNGKQILEVDLLTDSTQTRKARVNTVLIAVGRDPNTSIFKNV